MTTEKVFFGHVKAGRFNEGNTHVKLKLSGEDIKKIIGIGKAKGDGTWQTADRETGEEVNFICFDIKTSKSGKMYMELDTWKPDPAYQGQGTQNPSPVSAQPVNAVPLEEDDLPF